MSARLRFGTVTGVLDPSHVTVTLDGTTVEAIVPDGFTAPEVGTVGWLVQEGRRLVCLGWGTATPTPETRPSLVGISLGWIAHSGSGDPYLAVPGVQAGDLLLMDNAGVSPGAGWVDLGTVGYYSRLYGKIATGPSDNSATVALGWSQVKWLAAFRDHDVDLSGMTPPFAHMSVSTNSGSAMDGSTLVIATNSYATVPYANGPYDLEVVVGGVSWISTPYIEEVYADSRRFDAYHGLPDLYDGPWSPDGGWGTAASSMSASGIVGWDGWNSYRRMTWAERTGWGDATNYFTFGLDGVTGGPPVAPGGYGARITLLSHPR